MMITPNQVPLWLVNRYPEGNCIVISSDTRWHRTPHSLSIGGETTHEMPKRICRKCREAMKDLNLQKQ